MKYLKILFLASICTFGYETLASQNPKKEYNNIHGYLSVATNNNFKGISYTNNGPSLNGGVVYNDPKGISLGFDAGNTTTPGSTIWLYPYLDFTKDIDNSFYTGAQLGYYFFPKYSSLGIGANPQHLSLKGKLGYKLDHGKIQASLAYSPNYYYKSGAAYRPEISAEYYLPSHFMLQGELGYQYTKVSDKYRGKFDITSLKKGGWRTHNFAYYKVGLFKDINSIIVGVEYHGNTNSKRKCSESLSKICQNGVVGSLTHLF